MFDVTSSLRIGIYGPEEPDSQESRSFALWPIGYAGAIAAAGAHPVFLKPLTPDTCWKEHLHGIDGIVLTGNKSASRQIAEEESLCRWCKEHGVPLLGVDEGMQALNGTFGGTLFMDLSRELPEALQHRHPPEKGLRHAINVVRGTGLADLYGEGEVVVNSEHRQAVRRLGRGFRVSATALDGVVEAIETETDDWFALGVQWRPASASASGLDIQVFRGLIDACQAPVQEPLEASAA